MVQEATSIFGHFIKSDVEMDEAVSRVKETRVIETMVPGKKGWIVKGMEQGNDFRAIFHPQTADFNADLPKVKLTATQPFAFLSANIFI
jgi:hypothetical protein